MSLLRHIPNLPEGKPVLIAGPTASGKSALALEIAAAHGGTIINADALQVFDGWRILTARPSDADLQQADHRLYGHVPFDQAYSVGDWLRDVVPLLDGPRPIIVGGTGLYFKALTEGLAPIPPTPAEVRKSADQLPLEELLSDLDDTTRAGLDCQNRARVQRAWEVQKATGRSIADWQNDTPRPDLPLSETLPIVMMPEPDWLNQRIEMRFAQMIEAGVLDEARAMAAGWDPRHGSSKAIGASDLVAQLHGQMSPEDVREATIIGTRQYAKRQRTWFRSRMASWEKINPANMASNSSEI